MAGTGLPAAQADTATLRAQVFLVPMGSSSRRGHLSRSQGGDCARSCLGGVEVPIETHALRAAEGGSPAQHAGPRAKVSQDCQGQCCLCAALTRDGVD